jgi:hypothetical protein
MWCKSSQIMLQSVGYSPTSEIDDGGAQHEGGGSPHPLG